MAKVWKDGKVTEVDASTLPPCGERHEQVKPGVYELPTGEIYVVKPNQKGTHVYAKRLVETPSERVTEQGEHVKFDFVYESGAIFKIWPEHQMDLKRARELMIRYGRCIVCGAHLKVAQSVERGIGPVCIKYFRAAGGQVPTEQGEEKASPSLRGDM